MLVYTYMQKKKTKKNYACRLYTLVYAVLVVNLKISVILYARLAVRVYGIDGMLKHSLTDWWPLHIDTLAELYSIKRKHIVSTCR